jgi:hypothetical protein
MRHNTEIQFTQVNNDYSGNPRYVCHYLNIAENYDTALKIAHKFGGRKFHNKQYGGGIVFSCMPPEAIEAKIKQFSMIHNLGK